MKQNSIVKFKIEHLDPMGQGVSKLDGKILFIPKTLPGEEGEAHILFEQKKVSFGSVFNLLTTSPLRQEPECPHYQLCPACNYQHTNYENELNLKVQSLKWTLKNLWQGQIKTHAAPSRFSYRNRIQVHYDIETKKFGIIQNKNQEILSIPDCLLPTDNIKRLLKEWTANNNWLNFLPKNAPPTGHVEFYEKNNNLQIYWNEPYSSGGFTQVNQIMNDELTSLIGHTLSDPQQTILDLFGGNGNLSNQLKFKSRTIIDAFSNDHKDFVRINLNQNDSLSTFQKKIKETYFDSIIIDPPRTGFYFIKEYLEHLKFKNLILVSCFPATLKRDLERISHLINIKSVHLIDLFPATQHFETLIIAKSH
jgi:23S rRNA (uracil1939-C5)-methyltransferase